MSVWKFIFNYLSKTKVLVGVILLSFVIRSINDRVQKYILAELIGFLPQYAENEVILNKIVLYLFIFSLLLILHSFTSYVWQYSGGKFLPYFNSLVYKDLFIAVHHHSLRFFHEEMAGSIASKAKNVVSGIQTIYRHIVFGIIMPITGLFTSLAFITYTNTELGLFFSVLYITILIIVVKIRYNIGSYSERRAKASSESDGIFVDTVTNSDLIKSFANYFYEKKRFYQAVKKATKAEQKELIKDAFYNWSGKTLFDVACIISYSLSFYYWYKKEIDISGVVLCTSLVNGLIMEINNLGFFAGEFSRYYGQVKDGLNLLYKPNLVMDEPNAHNIKMRNKSINICNIKYHYDGKEDLFFNFNLRIKSGEKIGLVGHSGSGKSTLIKLLARYYDLDDGKIIIGGENIKQVKQESLRDKISVIPQDTTLFNRSILENIRYGNVQATDEEVYNAAKKAYADEFINKLPKGYHSKVGERGVMLSGGERQRIAIARAILKNAPILILDEATSALDSKSEQYIQKSLKKLMKGKTVIAIAHRLSTLKEMDRLIVMDKGKIIEEGSHDYLISKGGAYSEFYSIQSLNK